MEDVPEHAVQEHSVQEGARTGQAEGYNAVSTNYQAVDGIKLLELLSIPKGSTVLDLGCGTGNLTAAIAERVGPLGHVTGVDPDRERIKVAREKNAKDNITFLEADGETFPEDQYDLVFSNYVIHWIENKEPVFQKVHKNLRKGGRFAFNMGVRKIPFVVAAIKQLFQRDRQKELGKSIHYVPMERIKEIISKCGFTIAHYEEKTIPRVFPSVDSALQYLYVSSHGKFDLALANEGALENFKQKYPGEVTLAADSLCYILTKQ